jgi:pimeloyl-ACP methyl ester carboxylesterase
VRNAALLVVVTLTGFSGGCADTLILPPTPKPLTAAGTARRTLHHDGLTLDAYTARSPGAADRDPAAFVLRFTGGDASGSAAFTATRWGRRPAEVWVVNYPGYGDTSGPRSLSAMTSTALAAYDALRSIAGDRPIFVEGFSLGTVPALALAARRPVAGLILQNPPPLRQLILGRHGWWNLWLLAAPVALQVPADLDSLANARASTAPAIFLVAEKDNTIPLPYQQRIADAYAGPKRILLQRGADHFVPLNAQDEATLQRAIDELLPLPFPAAPNN